MGKGRDGGEVRRLYQDVADKIRALIRTGQFPPSSRLPAERDLAQQLAVSRPSLREALIALEIDGTVEIRVGSGVYVLAPVGRIGSATDALGESPTELMQARLAVEGAVVLLASARVTPSFLKRLDGTVASMRAAIAEDVDPMSHDRAFHLAIAEQTGNSVLARLVASLFDERFSRISARISSRYENRGSWTAAVHEHATLVRSLEARDSLGAQAAMTRHLQLSAERWVEP
ncbi:MAG: FadR/GntR family transcriptional regulator [Janthinobacterium lividum]